MDPRGRCILGIDPGSQRTGFALVRFAGDEVTELEIGTWDVTPRQSREQSLAQLSTLAETWLASRAPEAAAVESLFHHKNVRSALVLAEARGVLLAVIGRAGIPVHEYPPATVKRTVCGSGQADKEQVRRALLMTVRGLAKFSLDGQRFDATDALALAVTHRVHARFGAALVDRP